MMPLPPAGRTRCGCSAISMRIWGSFRSGHLKIWGRTRWTLGAAPVPLPKPARLFSPRVKSRCWNHPGKCWHKQTMLWPEGGPPQRRSNHTLRIFDPLSRTIASLRPTFLNTAKTRPTHCGTCAGCLRPQQGCGWSSANRIGVTRLSGFNGVTDPTGHDRWPRCWATQDGNWRRSTAFQLVRHRARRAATWHALCDLRSGRWINQLWCRTVSNPSN